MQILRTVSAAAFYAIGTVVILGVALASRGVAWSAGISTLLRVLDLPLLLSGMLYAGTCLVDGAKEHRTRVALSIVAGCVLGAIFLAALYANFVAAIVY